MTKWQEIIGIMETTDYNFSMLTKLEAQGGMIGLRIEESLKQQKLSQKHLAMMIGVTESALSRYINGEREPKMEVLANIATALNTTVDYLVTGKEEQSDFESLYRLVARGSRDLDENEKMKLIEAILRKV